MPVAISFKPTFSGKGQHSPEEACIQALEAAKQHGRVVMVLSVNGHSVDYGVCRVRDYRDDLLEELELLSSGEDHEITMSGYTVGSVRRTGSEQLCVTLYTADGARTSEIAATELVRALKEAERRLQGYHWI